MGFHALLSRGRDDLKKVGNMSKTSLGLRSSHHMSIGTLHNTGSCTGISPPDSTRASQRNKSMVAVNSMNTTVQPLIVSAAAVAAVATTVTPVDNTTNNSALCGVFAIDIPAPWARSYQDEQETEDNLSDFGSPLERVTDLGNPSRIGTSSGKQGHHGIDTTDTTSKVNLSSEELDSSPESNGWSSYIHLQKNRPKISPWEESTVQSTSRLGFSYKPSSTLSTGTTVRPLTLGSWQIPTVDQSTLSDSLYVPDGVTASCSSSRNINIRPQYRGPSTDGGILPRPGFTTGTNSSSTYSSGSLLFPGLHEIDPIRATTSSSPPSSLPIVPDIDPDEEHVLNVVPLVAATAETTGTATVAIEVEVSTNIKSVEQQQQQQQQESATRSKIPRFMTRVINRAGRLAKGIRSSKSKLERSPYSGGLGGGEEYNSFMSSLRIPPPIRDPSAIFGCSNWKGSASDSSTPKLYNNQQQQQQQQQNPKTPSPPPKISLQIESSKLDVNVPSPSKLRVTPPTSPFVNLGQMRMNMNIPPRSDWIPPLQTRPTTNLGRRAMQQWRDLVAKRNKDMKGKKSKRHSGGSTSSGDLLRECTHSGGSSYASSVSSPDLVVALSPSDHANFPYPIPTPFPSQLFQRLVEGHEERLNGRSTVSVNVLSSRKVAADDDGPSLPSAYESASRSRADSLWVPDVGSMISLQRGLENEQIKDHAHIRDGRYSSTKALALASAPPSIPHKSPSRYQNLVNNPHDRHMRIGLTISHNRTQETLPTAIPTQHRAAVPAARSNSDLTRSRGTDTSPWVDSLPSSLNHPRYGAEYPTTTLDGLQPLVNIYNLLRDDRDRNNQTDYDDDDKDKDDDDDDGSVLAFSGPFHREVRRSCNAGRNGNWRNASSFKSVNVVNVSLNNNPELHPLPQSAFFSTVSLEEEQEEQEQERGEGEPKADLIHSLSIPVANPEFTRNRRNHRRVRPDMSEERQRSRISVCMGRSTSTDSTNVLRAATTALAPADTVVAVAVAVADVSSSELDIVGGCDVGSGDDSSSSIYVGEDVIPLPPASLPIIPSPFLPIIPSPSLPIAHPGTPILTPRTRNTIYSRCSKRIMNSLSPPPTFASILTPTPTAEAISQKCFPLSSSSSPSAGGGASRGPGSFNIGVADQLRRLNRLKSLRTKKTAENSGGGGGGSSGLGTAAVMFGLMNCDVLGSVFMDEDRFKPVDNDGGACFETMDNGGWDCSWNGD